ncbi:MFS transporter [Streptomyces coriariae]|uniref:MFS transporter n=1 Tax=Streptomyces coriariae TaxID=2864460 RepID=UPI001E29BCAD|nr:MFS transporter [Streptomyces coriariae]
MTTVEGRVVPPPRRLGPWPAFSLQASVVVFFLAGASAPTPLYATYQQEWLFSPITTTVIFGVYAVAVLLALLVVGSLSDHVGRKPVIFGSIVVQAAAVVGFAGADGVPALLCARILQGLATGTVVGAVGAGMIDIRRSAGTLANAVTPAAGTAVGALGSGLLVAYAPQPTHLVYHILLGIYVLQAVGVVFMAETAARAPGALRSLRVTWTVPAQARGPLLRVAPVVLAVWALAGFYGSLGPALVRRVVTGEGALLGGLALFTLTACGALTVLVLRSAEPRTTTRVGTVALIAGVSLTLLAVAVGSAGLFFVGTAVAGVGFGAGFQGGVRTVVPLAEPHQRSGLLSVLYLISYLGFGLPTVVAGVIVVYGGGVASAACEYGTAVMLLALLALISTFGPSRASTPATPEAVSGRAPGTGDAAVDGCADACHVGGLPGHGPPSKVSTLAHKGDEHR